MECNFFFLNLAEHPAFSAHKTLLLEYMENITSFAKRYFKERYNEEIDAHFYYPDFSPQTFEGLQEWDETEWRDKYFGKNIQMYCVFDKQLVIPKDLTGGADPAGVEGICLGEGKGELTIGDMTYAYMPEYHSLFAKDPYTWYENFGRLVFHELDHQLLRLQNSPKWISGVHNARKQPLEKWDEQKKDKAGNNVYFMLQQDPRKF